jgi:hypothetical protein
MARLRNDNRKTADKYDQAVHNGEDLFDLFTPHGDYGTMAGIVELGEEIVTRQIHELRAEPDDLTLTDREIAQRIIEYCKMAQSTAQGTVDGAGREPNQGCIVLHER